MERRRLTARQLSMGITLICVVFIIAVVGQTIMILNHTRLQQETFLEGVQISKINVSGLTKNQAAQQLGVSINKVVNEMNLTVRYNDKVWQFKGGDFKVQNDVKKVVEDAYQYQKKLLRNDKSFQANSIITKGLNVDVAFEFLFEDINQKLDAIIKEVEKEPINSQVIFSPNNANKFEYTKSAPGLKVDKIKLLKDIEKQFRMNPANIDVTLSAVKTAPKVTENTLKNQTALMSIFSTDLHNSKASRLHNVGLAFSKINGLIIKPNEEISFNTLTKPQTLEGGYEKSIIIFNGQFVEGVGGGLCQASTTLYNALILADLEILEVKKHTLPVGYIELALDAMVSENWSDLRFKNTSTSDVYLVAYIKEERAYVEVYGRTLDDGIKLKRRSEFIKTIGHPGDKLILDEKDEYKDLNLYKGERYRLSYPREGYEAKAYLQYYKDGNLLREKLIRHEVYEPQFGLVVEGVKEPPTGYTLKENDVTLIAPQKETSDTTGSNVSAVILKTNPPDYNP